MIDGGFIKTPRGLFQEPLLQDAGYFRAWLWLVNEAAWKPRRVMVSNGRTSEIIELERGQLSHSRCFMATAWGWSEKRVRTFLNRLQKVGMIGLQAGRLQTVVTICDFDTYQGKRDDEGRQTGPQTGRQGAGKGPEEEEVKEVNKRNSAREVAKNPKRWPEDGFDRWYALYPRKKDRGSAEKAFVEARAKGLIGIDELLDATRRFADSMHGKDPAFIKYPATWLIACSYLDEPDEPKGCVRDAAIANPSVGPHDFSDKDWKDRLNIDWKEGIWSNLWGPRPGEPGCKVPAHLLNGSAHG